LLQTPPPTYMVDDFVLCELLNNLCRAASGGWFSDVHFPWSIVWAEVIFCRSREVQQYSARGRQYHVIFHYHWYIASLKPSMLFFSCIQCILRTFSLFLSYILLLQSHKMCCCMIDSSIKTILQPTTCICVSN